MGILDEAIREHLELKRKHGAGDSELKQIEDEAFGPPARPDELQEPPPITDSEAEAPTTHMPSAEAEAPPTAEQAPPVAEPPPAPEAPPAGEPEPVAEEQHPAIEQEIVSEATAPEAAPEVEEREPAQAPAEETEQPPVAEEPTQRYDVLEGEVVTDDDAEFFDEQSLSDELDQALDAPAEAETGATEDAPAPEPLEEEPHPDEEVEPAAEDEEPPAGADRGLYDREEDVLEETPEFLQDTPEHDRLWFEQKPPKDFDFDD